MKKLIGYPSVDNLHNRDYFTREKLESILNSISLK